MPLDHYISQVHLKQFASPALPPRHLHAMRKSDLLKFPCATRDVCRIEDGSTNEYLRESRAIEEFLRLIEPNYDESLAKVRAGAFDADAIFVFAGFISFLLSCTPTAHRINTEPLEKLVEAQAILNADQLPPPPPELGGGSIKELFDSGAIVVDVEPKYPEAVSVSTIVEKTESFGNFPWDILLNEHDDCPFFTSDFPIAIEPTANPSILNRIFPIAPDVAIRIKPSRNPMLRNAGLGFPYFKPNTVNPSRHEVVAINQAFARCAEDLVFFRDDRPWVTTVIEKNRDFRLAQVTERIVADGQAKVPYGLTIARRPNT